MSRRGIVRRLKVKMNIAVGWRENAAMLCRMKPDNYCILLLVGECDLNFLEHLQMMWPVTGAVEDMELNQLLSPADEKRKRLIWVKPGSRCCLWYETFEVFERTDFERDRYR
jgi:hypothetical protein